MHKRVLEFFSTISALGRTSKLALPSLIEIGEFFSTISALGRTSKLALPSLIEIGVFPCGSEIGPENFRTLLYSIYFKLIGGSSVEDHGGLVCPDSIGDFQTERANVVRYCGVPAFGSDRVKSCLCR